MAHVTVLSCCGIKEIANIQYRDCPDILRDVRARYHNQGHALPLRTTKAAFYLFSEAGGKSRNKYGRKFAAWIEAQGLGTVVALDGARNPNSHREVRPFLWRVNQPALLKWWCEDSAAEEERIHRLTAEGGAAQPQAVP